MLMNKLDNIVLLRLESVACYFLLLYAKAGLPHGFGPIGQGREVQKRVLLATRSGKLHPAVFKSSLSGCLWNFVD